MGEIKQVCTMVQKSLNDAWLLLQEGYAVVLWGDGEKSFLKTALGFD